MNVRNTDSPELVNVTSSLNVNIYQFIRFWTGLNTRLDPKKGALLVIFNLIWGHPFLLYADDFNRNQKPNAQTDLNLHELPRLSEKFLRLTSKDIEPEEYGFYGIRILSQAGGYRIPGIDATSSTGYSAVGGIAGALVLGAEFAYVKKSFGMGILFDVAPAGLPVPGSSSITSQFSYKLGAHYYSKWFDRKTRFSFVYTPYTILVTRYPSLAFNHSGFGFGLEAQIQGPKWGDQIVNWIISFNWNRISWSNLSTAPTGTQANFDSGELMGSQGGASQMIYALLGMEFNFSAR